MRAVFGEGVHRLSITRTYIHKYTGIDIFSQNAPTVARSQDVAMQYNELASAGPFSGIHDRAPFG